MTELLLRLRSSEPAVCEQMLQEEELLERIEEALLEEDAFNQSDSPVLCIIEVTRGLSDESRAAGFLADKYRAVDLKGFCKAFVASSERYCEGADGRANCGQGMQADGQPFLTTRERLYRKQLEDEEKQAEVRNVDFTKRELRRYGEMPDDLFVTPGYRAPAQAFQSRLLA
ncbi:unnamed protein product [Symbiodinium sp. KB8]|nr:unnamed protein product [Symbiodinium sp. KB8]